MEKIWHSKCCHIYRVLEVSFWLFLFWAVKIAHSSFIWSAVNDHSGFETVFDFFVPILPPWCLRWSPKLFHSTVTVREVWIRVLWIYNVWVILFSVISWQEVCWCLTFSLLILLFSEQSWTLSSSWRTQWHSKSWYP